MDPRETQEARGETMTIPQLAARAGVHRSLIHRLAADPAEGWPPPVRRAGSTRAEYDVAWFDAYWEQRQASIRQGRRTDLMKDGGSEE